MENQLPQLQNEYQDLKKQLEDPAIFSSKKYPKLAKRLSELETVLELFRQKENLFHSLQQAKALLESEPEMKDLALAEISETESKIESINDELTEALLPKDPNDQRDAIIEIRAAAGGDEASLFAGDLYRMYARWAETHQYSIEVINQSPSEGGGFKEIIFAVRGVDAYKKFKFEAGVHRVQRVPATESQGRIHTSTATVAVLPEAEESDVELLPNELRIDVYRSSGHGGQSVNTTDSAVRITHLPTGIVVTCQDEKSQIKNKEKALGVLRSRLLQAKIDEEQQNLSDARKKLIGNGDRSEKIRTYNFPQDRITDHRIGYSRSNLPAALNGDIDDLFEQLSSAEHELMINAAT